MTDSEALTAVLLQLSGITEQLCDLTRRQAGDAEEIRDQLASLTTMLNGLRSAVAEHDDALAAVESLDTQVLPGAQDLHLGGVHDAHEEPGISGGVVGKVPVHVGEVPELRRVFGGGCCVRAGGSRERRGRLSRPGPWSAAGRGSAR